MRVRKQLNKESNFSRLRRFLFFFNSSQQIYANHQMQKELKRMADEYSTCLKRPDYRYSSSTDREYIYNVIVALCYAHAREGKYSCVVKLTEFSTENGTPFRTEDCLTDYLEQEGLQVTEMDEGRAYQISWG